MTTPTLVQTLQSKTLVREIEKEIAAESHAATEASEREARDLVTRARADARQRIHNAIKDLRRQGTREIARARARVETELRMREQRRTAQALAMALPLLGDALAARWRDPRGRALWTQRAAAAGRAHLRSGAWLVEHPTDWMAEEQREFAAAIGPDDGIEISFKADGDLTAGIRIVSDQARLDATPQGLLADAQTIGALLLDAIEQAGPTADERRTPLGAQA